MLALDFGKAFGRGLVGAGFELFEAAIVEFCNRIAASGSLISGAHCPPGQPYAGARRRRRIIAENIFDYARGRTPGKPQGNCRNAQQTRGLHKVFSGKNHSQLTLISDWQHILAHRAGNMKQIALEARNPAEM